MYKIITYTSCIVLSLASGLALADPSDDLDEVTITMVEDNNHDDAHEIELPHEQMEPREDDDADHQANEDMHEEEHEEHEADHEDAESDAHEGMDDSAEMGDGMDSGSGGMGGGMH